MRLGYLCGSYLHRLRLISMVTDLTVEHYILREGPFVDVRGRYSHIDFHAVIEAAKAELMNFVKTALT